MKVTSMEIHPSGSSNPPLVLSFRDPRALNPYVVKTILGLDAEEMVPLYSGVTEVTKLFNLGLKKRNVIIQTGLNPDFSDNESYSQLRDGLYRVIAASRTGHVELQFKFGDLVVAVISGFVSKFEADLFEKAQEVQLTLECKESMLKSPNPVQLDIDTLDPGNTAITDNRSTAPHGLSFILQFIATVSVLTIENEALGFSFTIRPRNAFVFNDLLYFSSEWNNRYLYVVSGGNTIHLADVIDLNSVWPIIFPGENEFQITPGAGSVFWTAISHYETYWGV